MRRLSLLQGRQSPGREPRERAKVTAGRRGDLMSSNELLDERVEAGGDGPSKGPRRGDGRCETHPGGSSRPLTLGSKQGEGRGEATFTRWQGRKCHFHPRGSRPRWFAAVHALPCLLLSWEGAEGIIWGWGCSGEGARLGCRPP